MAHQLLCLVELTLDLVEMEQGIYSDLYKTLYTSRFNSDTGTRGLASPIF